VRHLNREVCDPHVAQHAVDRLQTPVFGDLARVATDADCLEIKALIAMLDKEVRARRASVDLGVDLDLEARPAIPLVKEQLPEP